MSMSATYSPEDNKLRLYSLHRLDAETYARVSGAGFKFAPKQDLFVAPMWTPGREDLLIELCGEIGDEDTSLVDRAAERADRFEEYSDNRAKDAAAAHGQVRAITEHIPLGQPILVGHHSERRALKDAERIENGMRRAVQMWETSEYWARRAAGALRNAKYKELPAVRHRRIKSIEADKRKAERELADAEKFLAAWQKPDLTMQQALAIANYDHAARCYPLADFPRQPPASQYEGLMGLYSALDGGVISVAQAQEIAAASNQRVIQRCRRWLDHYENRLSYERAMLGEQGGIAADKFDIQPGGRVLIDGEWLLVKRVNRKAGKVLSVTTAARFVPTRGIEEVQNYQAPTEEQAAAVKAASKLPPMCNYPGEGFLHMTKAEWDKIHADYKGSRELGEGAKRPGGYRPDVKNAEGSAEKFGRHRVRVAVRGGSLQLVYISDAKRSDPPALGVVAAAPVLDARPIPADDAAPVKVHQPKPEAEPFRAMREQLKAGVQVVSAPQLFPTPVTLAARMVDMAGVERGQTVLEPSAGTGRLLRAIREATGGGAVRTAIEINSRLCDSLRIAEAGADVICCDFLAYQAPRPFDCVIMNPPFANAEDIAHIRHAYDMLQPGGRLVAICANGPRQRDQLMPLVEACGGSWEDLPADTFKDEGTRVNTALLMLIK